MTFTQKLIQFATNHWALVGGFLFLLVVLFFEEARTKGMGTAVSVHEAVNLMNHEDAVIIDIRDSESFSKGHISKARHIPKNEIDQKMDKLAAFKERPIIVVCDRGQTSMQVSAKLRKAGFEKAQSLSGGMYAWLGASMPTKEGKQSIWQK